MSDDVTAAAADRSAHTPNVSEVHAFLTERYAAGVSDVALAGQGEWSMAYGFTTGGSDCIIRFGRLSEDFEKDRIAAEFATPALPIPRILEIGEAFGGAYAISERAYGEFFESLDEAGVRAALPALFGALDAAREADVSRFVGYGLWDGDGQAPFATWREALLSAGDDLPRHRTHGWRRELARSPVGEQPFDEGLGRLRRRVDDLPEARHLLHCDLLNRNVLVGGTRVSAVIDWGCAMYGDFVYELAGITFWQPWFPAWEQIDIAAEARRHYATTGMDVPAFDERLACYEAHVGLAACAYNAYKQRWDELEWTMARTFAALDRVT